MQTETDRILGLLAQMDERAASDLFLTEGKRPAFRVHGQVLNEAGPPTARAAIEALQRSCRPACRTASMAAATWTRGSPWPMVGVFG